MIKFKNRNLKKIVNSFKRFQDRLLVSSATVFQDNLAQQFRDNSVLPSPDSSATMCQDKSATACPDSKRSKTARTFQGNNVPARPDRNAQLYQSEFWKK
jgi:hypothetical protein